MGSRAFGMPGLGPDGLGAWPWDFFRIIYFFFGAFLFMTKPEISKWNMQRIMCWEPLKKPKRYADDVNNLVNVYAK